MPPPPLDQIEPLVGTKEVAVILGCSRQTVIGLHYAQGLPAVRIGASYKFLISRVLAWRDARMTVVVRRQEVPPPPPVVTPRRGRMTRAEREQLDDEFPM